MNWITKTIFLIMYWTGFIAYLYTKDMWFAALQMTCLLLWFLEKRIGKVFNNTVTVNNTENNSELVNKINNIEQMLSVQKPFNVMKGSDLIFLKRISGDGEELIKINNGDHSFDTDNYKLTNLSISQGTYIAHGFNSYIVKLKK